jgi:hypothetical protein
LALDRGGNQMSEFQLLINGRLIPGDLEMPVINPGD